MIETSARPLRAAAPLAPYLALAAIWLLTITIVPPRGDFPLNDDWMYAKVVRHLVNTGEYQATPYADPTFILQAYWGAAFVKLLGFSFEALRASTLVLALVAVWAAHWAAREAGLSPPWAFLVALTLLVNPLFLNLSYTFMTDVPFLAFTTLSIAAFLRALRTSRFGWLWFGSTIAVAGFMIRQFSILVPAAVAPAFFLTMFAAGKAGVSASQESTVTSPSTSAFLQPVLRAAAALLIPWLAALALMKLLPLGGQGLDKPWIWDDLGNTPFARAVTILKFCATALLYLALFLLPVFGAFRKLRSREQPRLSPGHTAIAIAWEAFLFFGILLATARDKYASPPNLGNILYNTGVGPLLMPGMVDDGRIAAPMRLDAPWRLLVLIGILGAMFLALQVSGAVYRAVCRSPLIDRIDLANNLFLSLLALALIVVLVLPPVQARFDRYLVAPQVPLSILAARALRFRRRPENPPWPGMIPAVIIWAFGLVCLQDYLAWNAARWKALTALQRDHAVPLDQINGGYEFNGWFHSDHFAEESRLTGRKIFGPHGWWTLGDDYRVSLRRNDDFEVIGAEPYFSWLGWQTREVLLLKRTRSADNSALFN